MRAYKDKDVTAKDAVCNGFLSTQAVTPLSVECSTGNRLWAVIHTLAACSQRIDISESIQQSLTASRDGDGYSIYSFIVSGANFEPSSYIAAFPHASITIARRKNTA